MTIRKDDGFKIVQFIEDSLKIKLPKDGFLAGQSVCSALLYLKKKSSDFHVNDLDIFLPDDVLSIKDKKYFSNKQSLLLQNMTGSSNLKDNLNVELQFENEYMKVNEKEKYLIDLSQTKQKIITKTENYKKYLDNEFVPYTKGDIDEYTKMNSRNLLFNLEQQYNNYATKNVLFRLTKQKRVFDSVKKGIFNYIYIKDNMLQGFSPAYILSDFDINCTQIGIDLKNNKIYFTKEFNLFYNTLNLEIINADTPYHSIIRYFKKMEEFKYKGSLEFESFYIHNQLKLGLFSNKRSVNEYDNQYKVLKYCFGNIYLDKYKKNKDISNFFKISELKEEKDRIVKSRKDRNQRFLDYSLFELKSNSDDFDYIAKGQHKKEFEKQTGLNITSGYKNYLHLFMKKIIKNKLEYNKKTYSLLSDKYKDNCTKINEIKNEYKIIIVKNYDHEDLCLNKVDYIVDLITSKKIIEKYSIYTIINKFQKFKDLYNTLEYLYETHENTKYFKVKKYINSYEPKSKKRTENNYILPSIKKKINALINKEEERINSYKKSLFPCDFKNVLIDGYNVTAISDFNLLENVKNQNLFNFIPYRVSMINGEIQIYHFKNNSKSFVILLSKNNQGEYKLINFENSYKNIENKNEFINILSEFYKLNNIKKCDNLLNLIKKSI
jgi:hypothetical protein